ncbi:hypothetical protein V5799_024197, partial [Amblyomma americanum]
MDVIQKLIACSVDGEISLQPLMLVLKYNKDFFNCSLWHSFIVLICTMCKYERMLEKYKIASANSNDRRLQRPKMSSKVQRKVTVENLKESGDGPRRPSVFDRLGPGAVTAQERHSRNNDPGEQCRNWMRNGACSYGSKCRYQHEAYPPSSSSSSSRVPKSERDTSQKDLRHKVRHKQQDAKESVSRSPSPKRRKVSASSGAGGSSVTVTTGVAASSSGGSSSGGSRSRRPDAESKIKSTVVVTRPRSPPSSGGEEEQPAKDAKPPKNWEGAASDDWPIDDALLDYKEELSLEMKRQQLQRELDLLQKENHPASSGGSGGSKGTGSSGATTAAAATGAGPPATSTQPPATTKAARSAHPPQQV